MDISAQLGKSDRALARKEGKMKIPNTRVVLACLPSAILEHKQHFIWRREKMTNKLRMLCIPVMVAAMLPGKRIGAGNRINVHFDVQSKIHALRRSKTDLRCVLQG